MELITTQDLKKATGIKSNRLANIVKNRTKLTELNSFYESVYCDNTAECLENILTKLKINIKVDERELKYIPKEGGFVTVSNHPFGAIDGIILAALIYKQRPDYRIMANFLLQKVEPLKELFVAVNPFTSDGIDEKNIGGFRKVIELLNSDTPIGFFPAGEVSSWQSDTRKITDKQWDKSVIRLIKKAEKPIIPIYFEGSNSLLFHTLGLLHPSLRTAKLPSEFLNMEGSTITIRIGKPISTIENRTFTDADRFGRYLRARVYALQQQLEVKKFFTPSNFLPAKSKLTPAEIIAPVATDLLIKDIEALSDKDKLFNVSKFEVYCTSVHSIPNVIKEIGRLREITFRAIGEGSLKEVDLDEFDLYYQHLFIWDSSAKQIVGAYRVGKGKEIMARFGRKGFYLNSLFKWKDGFDVVMKDSIELGRSFVCPAYQKHPYSLFLLWKGIASIVINNAEYKYIIGPVSISNNFNKLSKDLIVSFIKKHYYDTQLSLHVKARKKYKVKKANSDVSMEMLQAEDIDKLDTFIDSIELGQLKIPVLLKKYLKQNAKIIGFNVDPSFNNCLDGLMILDFKSIDMSSIADIANG